MIGREHRADRYRTHRLAEDGHVGRITDEIADVVAHPGERGELIAQAVVTRARVARIEPTSSVQPSTPSR